MKEIISKYIFYISSVFILIIMLFTSRDAGITCDEIIHFKHSVLVYNYFATHGEDQSALYTPVTHLQYYGQSYDNIVTILTKWFNIDNIYRFRNLMSSFAGWLVILITAQFAVWLSGYKAGIITLFLFAVSPTFIGHTQNNLKDIPFALGYISSTFYTLKFLVSGRKVTPGILLLLTVSIAFSMSLRAGGLLLICYLFFFFFLYNLLKYLIDKKFDFTEIRTKLLWITCISVIAWLLSILLWPYALKGPVKSVFESYRVMAHFPDTFRQIFEGKVEWSDFMPWYYLPKSMVITIPVVVLTGLILFSFLLRSKSKPEKTILYGFITFTVVFPLIFVIYEKSNLYSSWRQFLFIYPAIVLLAATGFHYCIANFNRKLLKWGTIVILTVLSVHPLKFMISNHPYYYLYYNQFVNGLKGAYAKYETDYYYVSQSEASEWLIDYLNKKNSSGTLKVSATNSIQWQFRDHPEIETSYIRYEERSLSDWDYAIVVNRYIPPFQLDNKIWPPKNAIHKIYVDQVPVCVVMERRSKDGYYGYLALNEGRNKEAIKYFEEAIRVDDKDEMIFYNYAAALYNDKQYLKADTVLKMGLEINPDFEPILMYLGNIAKSQNNADEAIRYYERLIGANRKYFEAYVALSELLADSDVIRARALLRTCLTMNSRYKPAIIALADTYRTSNPDIARKYDELANSIEQ